MEDRAIFCTSEEIFLNHFATARLLVHNDSVPISRFESGELDNILAYIRENKGWRFFNFLVIVEKECPEYSRWDGITIVPVKKIKKLAKLRF